MKSSMQTRLIMISSGMLVLAIACICFANIFWLPYYYQSEKVSNMKNAYNNGKTGVRRGVGQHFGR